VGRGEAPFDQLAFHPDGDRVAAVDSAGRALMWSLEDDSRVPIRVWRGTRESTFWTLHFDPTGTLLIATDESGNTVVWGTDDPPDADPLTMITAMSKHFWLDFTPDGHWFANIGPNGLGVYPFDRERYGWVMRGHEATVEEIRFGPDGDWLVSASLDGTVRLWGLDPANPQPGRILCSLERVVREHLRLDVAPDGTYVVVTTPSGEVLVVPVDGSQPSELRGLGGGGTAVAVAPDNRRIAAAAGGLLGDGSAEIRVWDLDSGEIEWSDLDVPGHVWDLQFSATGELMAAVGEGELRRYRGLDGPPVVVAKDVYRFSAAADGDLVVALSTTDHATGAAAAIHDAKAGSSTRLDSHGNQLWALAMNPRGDLLVTGSKDRAVRVAPPSVDEPHLLFGHEAMVHAVAISHDGRWVASGSRDGTVRLWKVPSGTPIQSLPLPEFLTHMYQNCQYDYVEDPTIPIGNRMEPRPFAGWRNLPAN
jgi:WD40 repeat protein